MASKEGVGGCAAAGEMEGEAGVVRSIRRTSQFGSDLGWVRLDRADVAGVPRRVRASSYPPQICAG